MLLLVTASSSLHSCALHSAPAIIVSFRGVVSRRVALEPTTAADRKDNAAHRCHRRATGRTAGPVAPETGCWCFRHTRSSSNPARISCAYSAVFRFRVCVVAASAGSSYFISSLLHWSIPGRYRAVLIRSAVLCGAGCPLHSKQKYRTSMRF